ncbi:galactose-3-O-sulfotransferase 2-like [Lingula anatina]|uniref:Galactose-3-O-sulfotransferase 2-like n=1 Tax=Lingula anatina TaxID=7574 RepID=A0A1S3HFN2_LINAN|nr:galactose-3-O-sulfotransferase 2-like [Lingula anatina]|eukprot:XP_013384887.1 galactose-3-O-sulfotransferase 2-like [Lingula anatina]
MAMSALGVLLLLVYIKYMVFDDVSIRNTPRPACPHREDRGFTETVVTSDTQTPPSTAIPDAKRTSKVTNVLFLKTHKTASSTVLNILMRFGEMRNLTFALGASPVLYRLGYPEKFLPGYALPLATGRYDMLCHHARYSSAMMDVVPIGTVFITILRHPVKLVESWFAFFKIAQRLHVDMDTFLKAPHKYYSKYGIVRGLNMVFTNPMLFDLGMDPIDSLNQTKVYNKILEIDEVFSLVMIAEYFDESLILLKYLLNWSFHDIVYFRQNARKKTDDKTEIISLNRTRNIQITHGGDMKLYDHFNKTFWRRVHTFGVDRMQRELKQFDLEKQYWEKRCISKLASYGNITNEEFRPYETMVLGYELAPEMTSDVNCVLMATTQLPFTRKIYRRMLNMNQLKSNVFNAKLIRG